MIPVCLWCEHYIAHNNHSFVGYCSGLCRDTAHRHRSRSLADQRAARKARREARQDDAPTAPSAA